MTRTILSGVFAVLGVCAVGFLPTSCQSGGIGDPCTPEDEYNPLFGGFKVTEDNIESRSFQCQSRICLVNHFQGRVTCPLGQGPRTGCTGEDDTTTCAANGGVCKQATVFAPFCCNEKNGDCLGDEPVKCETVAGMGYTCNTEGHFCACADDNTCPMTDKDGDGVRDPDDYHCVNGQCRTFICHVPNSCQTANPGTAGAGGGSGDANAANEGKDCCIPGTDTPVASPVCGQCEAQGGRNADKAVYCSCRCGEAFDDQGNELPRDPNFHYCDCPDGFDCKEIRKDIGISDPQLSGQYCVKKDTATTASEAGSKCGAVKGFFASGTAGTVKCDGTPSN
jgi:hypothetical protein